MLMTEEMIDRSRRQRQSSMALCSATDKTQAFEVRLESARLALAQWTPGSFQYEDVLKQVSDLKNFLVVEVA